ncbi:MAG: hypothetical protein OEM67_13405, partial [Thermoleophilia bacterium]|nr:hypothetical protein [Thermoleophilia bacterium]
GPQELRLIRQTLRRLPELGADHAALALERTVPDFSDLAKTPLETPVSTLFSIERLVRPIR